jgi:hypothetical protein
VVLVDLADGRLRWEARIKAPADPAAILALRGDRRLLLAVQRKPPESDAPRHMQQMAQGHELVDGPIFQFDAESGLLLWTRDLTAQGLRSNYPMSAPALTFYRRSQTVERDANGHWRAQPPVIRVLAVDARTGKSLHERQYNNVHEANYGLEFDPQENALRIRTSRESIALRYEKLP